MKVHSLFILFKIANLFWIYCMRAAARIIRAFMSKETATLAGGCFWGMEEILRQVPGIMATNVGYTGGHTQNPVYEDVCRGNTGHAEAIQIVFDPKQISFDEILGF